MPITTSSLQLAQQAWSAALGAEHVIADRAALELASTATYPTQGRVRLILRPGSVEEVAECLRVANRHQVPLYPVSTGKNWGYGSRVPCQGEAALLELHRLNRILEHNEDLGYVTVEPGVTFGQLEAHLDGLGSRHFMSAPGTTQDASVIGNALERGWGFGPYSDRFDFMCGMQVVLPDGEIVETGMERFPGARSARIFRWGVGPWFDGMFTQSNLGVVTRMTIFLAEKPTHLVSLLYRVNDESRLPGLVDALRSLKMRQILRTNFKLQNFYRQLMAKGPFPWDLTGGAWTLSEAQRAEALSQHAIGNWNGAGALYCWSEAQALAETELVRAALAPHVDHLLFLNAAMAERADELQAQVKAETGWDLRACLKRYYHDTRFIGCDKANKGLDMSYWRKRTPMPAHPDLDRDRVGFIWVDPIIPFRGAEVQEATDLVARIQQAHGFEANIGLNCVTERSIFITGAIVYDRDVSGHDERALACARELADKLFEAGYMLGRLTTESMELLGRAQAGSRRLQERVKQALDPQRILAPGRYEA